MRKMNKDHAGGALLLALGVAVVAAGLGDAVGDLRSEIQVVAWLRGRRPASG